MFALGEPTHGIKEFPLLRNDILGHLVERGYRSVILETDFFAASIVDDHVAGAPTDLDTVLATGFSHGFGAVPGNRELVGWLRAHNASTTPEDRVRFYGFDAPTEYAFAPSPRRALNAVNDFLPEGLRPGSVRELDTLLGADTDWTNEAAMYDPAASIGDSDRARALRIIADELATALDRAGSRPGYDQAQAQARTGLGLLRYHAAMASHSSERIAAMLGVRAEMMAENLLAIVNRETRPGLVFAHNVHLNRTEDSAGGLVARALGEKYLFVATDASPDSEPGTLQRVLAEATDRRALFPARALPRSVGTSKPIVPGHIPLSPADLDGADAVIFIADTDGQRHRYW